MDFAKLVDVFDANEVTFVSVTQSFNTTTSMGRLTLNILLSFAQFEREVIGERIFERFVRLGSATKLVIELTREGVRHKRGKPIDKGFLYKLLNNRLYIGDALHKGRSHPGEHEAIISQDLSDQVHSILQESPRRRACKTRAQTPALLKGLIFGP